MNYFTTFFQEFFSHIATGLSNFIYFYPFAMAYIWMAGAIYYYFKWERKEIKMTEPPVLDSHPMVSIIIPCYNEADHIKEIIEQLYSVNYPNYEIIAVNDGSTDNTFKVMLNTKYPTLPNPLFVLYIY